MKSIQWKEDFSKRRLVLYYATWTVGLLLTALVAIWGVREYSKWGFSSVLVLVATFLINDKFIIKSDDNHRKSLQADKKFNPGIISEIRGHLFAFDVDSRTLCVSQREDTNKYRVLYFDRDELVFKISLEATTTREVIKTESASYGQKTAGALLGGAPGVFVANALGAKYEDGELITNITKVTLGAFSCTEAYEVVELTLYDSSFGTQESKLEDECQDYAKVLEFREEMAKLLSREEVREKLPILKRDVVTS